MHQGHNIPWHIITENFKLIIEDKRFTPPRTGLAPKSKDVSSKELIHFIRKFCRVINDFSETERLKYPPSFPAPTQGKIFPDHLLEKHRECLDKRNQHIEYWIERARRVQQDGSVKVLYDAGDGDLANVVTVLLAENQLGTLLMMARHPLIPMGCLRNVSYHVFGFSRVKESALHAYLYFNCAEATGILEGGQYADVPEYGTLLFELACSRVYPAQHVLHKQFLQSTGIYDSTTGEFNGLKGGPWVDTWAKGLYVHEDYALLQEYMKDLFALMYRYDMLVKECGVDPQWEGELVYYSPLNRVVRIESVWMEETNSYKDYLV